MRTNLTEAQKHPINFSFFFNDYEYAYRLLLSNNKCPICFNETNEEIFHISDNHYVHEGLTCQECGWQEWEGL